MTQKTRAGEKYEIKEVCIVTVIEGNVRDRTGQILQNGESSVYYPGNHLTAEIDSFLTTFDIKDPNIILNKVHIEKEFGNFCRTHWKQLRELYDVEGFEKVDLYRGDQIEIQSVSGSNYKLNLWFCGKDVDCLWHNQHNFIEFHTSIAGDGYMQKSLDGADLGICETVGLLPGNSHRFFNIPGEIEKNGNPKYPFHRWLGGTSGNIWLAIEKYN